MGPRVKKGRMARVGFGQAERARMARSRSRSICQRRRIADSLAILNGICQQFGGY